MSNVGILNRNYVDGDTLTSQTYSSQQTLTPATNVQARTRRTKVWRSNGYWEITSSNNVVKFKETSGGATLTATIAVANYVSVALFLAAVKAALEATGDSTYTVVQDTTTLKIKITSDGSGGTGDLELLWTNVGSTAATILGFSTGADDTGALTYTADVLKIHTIEWLRWDLGTGSLPKAFILIGKRNDGIQLTSDAVVTLEGNTTDVWTSPQYSQVLTWQEDALYVADPAGLYPSGLRYWRLTIQDASNPDGYVEISNIYLGEVYTPTQGSVQFPFASDYIDYSKTDYSETGIAFSDVRQMAQSFDVHWFGLTKTDLEALDDFIKTYGLHFPFFVSLDPDGVFSSSANKWTKYCRFDSEPKFSLDSPNVFSADWRLREEV